MAKKTNNEELKQQALKALAQGRAEISAELHHLRKHLTPARVVHRVVQSHPSAVVVLAFIAGMIPARFLFRRKVVPDRALRLPAVSVTHAPPKPLLGALLMGALGFLVKSIAPALIKSSLLPHLLASFTKPPLATSKTRIVPDGKS